VNVGLFGVEFQCRIVCRDFSHGQKNIVGIGLAIPRGMPRKEAGIPKNNASQYATTGFDGTGATLAPHGTAV
jgi:hypothetical protein